MDKWMEYIVKAEEAGRKVDSILKGSMGVSRRLIQKLTRNKGFLLNGKPTFLSRTVQAGDKIKIRVFFEEEGKLIPIEMPLNILYEDEDVLVVNKPSNMEVHPPEQGGRNRITLANGVAFYFLQHKIPSKVRPLHRLDKGTSGVVVFAKHGFAHGKLDRQLKDKSFRREYLAVTCGVPVPEASTINEPIGRVENHPTKREVRADGQHAVTHYHVMKELAGGKAALVKVELETGRTHQIRVHFQHKGYPLLGDEQYEAPKTIKTEGIIYSIDRVALHAFQVRFHHPQSNKLIEVKAPFPDDMAVLVDG